MVWRRILVWAFSGVLVSAAVFVAMFYFGHTLLMRLVSWALPHVSGWDLGAQMVTWVGQRDRIETAITVAWIVFTVGGSLAQRSLRMPYSLSASRMSVDEACESLAATVAAQWRQEAVERGLANPQPIMVRWSKTDLPISATDEEIAGTAGQLLAESSQGSVGTVAAEYRRLPSSRLVVIGAPGAGKTSLAVVAIGDLLARRVRHEPVPVLLPAATWDPLRMHFDDWIISRLRDLYPAIMRPGAPAGQDMATHLVQHGLILPIIDGLDEIEWPSPPAGQEQDDHNLDHLKTFAQVMIMSINRALAGDLPIILTCRRFEYEAIITLSEQPLARAAVVEILPVEAADVAEFLPAGQLEGKARWAQVVAHLADSPTGALATVLSAPLMVYLARTVYASGDPGRLTTLNSQNSIESHLYKGYVPAIYAKVPRPRHIDTPTHRAYPSTQARRWLGFIAVERRGLADGCLDDLLGCRSGLDGTAQYPLIGPVEFSVGLVSALLFAANHGLGIGLLAGIGYMILASNIFNEYRPLNTYSIVSTILSIVLRAVAGCLVGLAAGLWAAQVGGWEQARVVGYVSAAVYLFLSVGRPARTALELGLTFTAGWGIAELTHAGNAVVFGIAAVAASLLIRILIVLSPIWYELLFSENPYRRPDQDGEAPGEITGDIRPGRVTRMAWSFVGHALAFATGCGLAVLVDARQVIVMGTALFPLAGLTFLAWVELRYRRSPQPMFRKAFNWRRIRRRHKKGERPRSRPEIGPGWLYVITVTAGFAVVDGPAAAAWIGLGASLLLGLAPARMHYYGARVWLAMHGWLPWRLQRFLEDACDRGVLRKSGGEYHFRHANIETFLAVNWPASLRP